MQRKWLWLLAVFGIFCAASTATANVFHYGKTAVMAEESSFAVSSTTPAMINSYAQGWTMEMNRVEAANIGNTLSMGRPMAADEDGARIGYTAQPIDGEKKLAVAIQVDRINVANAAYLNLAATVVPNATSAAQISSNRTSTRSANPQDAAALSAQPGVWAPNLTAGADTTPAPRIVEGTTVPIGQEVSIVIKWTMPAGTNPTVALG